ncbi:DNA polymerase I [Betaproteobacteria bacterium]|nr:DNA polymerase I [Betaproteobacteria bacterium]
MRKKIKKNFLVVDASSFLYRAYHAMPDLRNKKDFPTGAITGMINMLRKTREEWPADIGLCVFDPKGPTFREEVYSAYKANRSKMPDDLSIQTPVIFEIIEAMGWPILSIPGYEADDVIGTVTNIASQLKFNSIIISGDKDLAQLVRNDIVVVDSMRRDGVPAKILDEEGVLEKFGVPPSKIIDYLALLGDSVDNIPGVSKVGPKTAKKWLEEYGNLDEIIKNAGFIKGAVGENLRKSLEWLPQGKNLITIKKDVDIGDVAQRIEKFCSWKKTDEKKIEKFRSEYELFNSLKNFSKADEYIEAKHNPIKKIQKPNYRLINTEESFNDFLRELDTAKIVAFDTETTSLNVRSASLVGISFSLSEGTGVYIPLAHTDENVDQLATEYVLKSLDNWFQGSCTKVAHNLKYDLHILLNAGVKIRGPFEDTMLMSYVLEANRKHDLTSLAERHLGRSGQTYEELTGKGAKQICFSEVPIVKAMHYSCEDADFTIDLYFKLSDLLAEEKSLNSIYKELEMPCLEVLVKMEQQGVKIDKNVLHEQTKELTKRISTLESKSFELAGENFNLGSPKQVSKILFEKLGYSPVKKTASGAPSTDESVLEKLSIDYPLPKFLLDWRTFSKLKTTYTEKLPLMIYENSGRVHTNFAQAVAVTGRLASSEPNLQNIPVKTEQGRKIREAFIAEEGFRIISADYSQIELRIMAHMSKDAALTKAFLEGADVHSATASEIFTTNLEKINAEQRRTAKVINFGLIYGMGAFGLSKSLGISRDAANNYIDRYFRRYPGVASFMQETKASAKKNGFVQTLMGRKLWLPEINSPNGPRRQAAERAAINAPMQGTAADLIKMAMIRMHAELEKNIFNAKMILQVHDELVFEVHKDQVAPFMSFAKELMCKILELKVPLEVDVGHGENWEKAH